MSRPDFMSLALAEAEAAGARGEVPIGAVIVRDGEVIARAGNRTRELPDATAHAEMLAIREASRILSVERLDECDLYVTLEPCAMCAGAISFARIRRLYFGATDPKGGAVISGVRFFASPTCHHAPDIYPGIDEIRSSQLLKSFFLRAALRLYRAQSQGTIVFPVLGALRFSLETTSLLVLLLAQIVGRRRFGRHSILHRRFGQRLADSWVDRIHFSLLLLHLLALFLALTWSQLPDSADRDEVPTLGG